MAATTAGTKTLTIDQSPAQTAAKLTAILAKPIELCTVGEIRQLQSALSRVQGGGCETTVIGTLLS